MAKRFFSIKFSFRLSIFREFYKLHWFAHVLCRGKIFFELPYVVKGMDVSFSGILSFLEVRTLSDNVSSYSKLFTYVSIFLIIYQLFIFTLHIEFNEGTCPASARCRPVHERRPVLLTAGNSLCHARRGHWCASLVQFCCSAVLLFVRS